MIVGHAHEHGDPAEVTIRQYTGAEDYAREVAQLAADGWRVVSVLERPPLPDLAHRLTFGLSARFRPPAPERLVTYSRPAGFRPPVPQPELPAAAATPLPVPLPAPVPVAAPAHVAIAATAS
jgi:hypothetical protein